RGGRRDRLRLLRPRPGRRVDARRQRRPHRERPPPLLGRRGGSARAPLRPVPARPVRPQGPDAARARPHPLYRYAGRAVVHRGPARRGLRRLRPLGGGGARGVAAAARHLVRLARRAGRQPPLSGGARPHAGDAGEVGGGGARARRAQPGGGPLAAAARRRLGRGRGLARPSAGAQGVGSDGDAAGEGRDRAAQRDRARRRAAALHGTDPRMSRRVRPTAHARARARGIAGALVIMSSVAAGSAVPGPRSGIGDLPARVVHAHAEFDVFVPAGAHAGSSFKCFAPIGLSPQVPLRVAVATVPAGEAKRWSYDKDGMLVVDLGDQTGEKHVALMLDVDVFLMESVGHDDVESTGSSYRKTAGAAQKPYLRPLAGTNPDDPDIAKLAATLKPKAQDLVALARAIEGVVHEKVKEGAAGHDAAGDALRRGSGGRLARANLAVALFLAQSVPVRLLGTVPARGSGSFEYLVDVNAGDAGWLRLDPL